MRGRNLSLLAISGLVTSLAFGVAASCTGAVGDDPVGAGGAGGETSEETGCAADVDCDDSDDCTVDLCSDGLCSNETAADSAPCSVDGTVGTCLSGECRMPCNPGDACDDNEPCTDDRCDDATLLCEHDALPDSAQIGADVAGDCVSPFCVAGVTLHDPQNTDLPNDDNPCTEDVCNDGIPSNALLPEGTSCGLALVCNAVGVCLGCIVPSDCTPPSSPCLVSTCVDSACGTTPGNAGAPCSDGTFCNGQETCNNSGSCISPGNPCDGPDGDGDCSETCDEAADNCAGNDPKDTPCEDGLWCNGADECNPQGACSQHSGSPCPGPDGDSDCSETCNESDDACNANDTNGTDCNGVPSDTICCASGQCTTSANCIP